MSGMTKGIRVSPRLALKLMCITGIVAACGPAAACKYSVRDVAFVDLGVQRYQLLIFDRGERTKTLADATARVAAQVLADANASVSVVDLNDQPNHPALALLESPNLERLPLCTLVSPDGRALPLEWELTADVSDAELRELLTSVVKSPRCAEIMQSVLSAHSVILVINGDDASVNAPVRQSVENAVRQVRDSLDLLPKPIAYPPRVVVMELDEVAKEKILLWSLGVEPPGKQQARVVVLLGRGRIIGPPVTFPGADAEQQLLTNLAAVGQDCECGLDRSWMQGEMIPHFWSEVREAEAMKELGFDPGGPLVKAEISRILQRGPGARRLQEPNILQPELGYREIVLEDALERPADERPAVTVAAPSDAKVEDPPSEATEPVALEEEKSIDLLALTAEQAAQKPDPNVSLTGETAGQSPPKIIIIVLTAVGLVALIGAGVILLRGRRGASA
jgi:hypothetical protein